MFRLVFGLLLIVALVESTSWYATYGVNEKLAEYLKEKRCFRGTYGLDQISLLTCQYEESQFLATLPDHSPVCLLELAEPNDKEVANLALGTGEVTVIYNEGRSVVLAAKNPEVVDYPRACFAEEIYSGKVWNLIPVPTQPIHPMERHELPQATAPIPRVQTIINAVSASRLQAINQELAGTTRINTSVAINTRHSQSTAANGAAEALKYVQGFLTNTSFFQASDIVLQPINRTGYFSNVAARIRGTVNPNNWIVIGAHLDDRMQTLSDSTSRAPGADDNGSGSAALLHLAELIAANKTTFQNTIMLTWFSGEEQGLYGSNFQANQMRNSITPFGNVAGLRVLGMYNIDMIGWNQSSATNQLAFMSGSADATLTNNCRTTLAEYAIPGLTTGTTSACCSDQQSYYNAGFPSLGIFETATTRVVYPYYHMSTDLPVYVDFNQVARFSKGLFSCALAAASPTN